MVTIYNTRHQSVRDKLILAMLKIGTYLHTKLYFKRKAWNINSQSLSFYPPESLGNYLFRFYTIQKFEPIPKAERHDVYHVLLNFNTRVKDETCLQFLLMG